MCTCYARSLPCATLCNATSESRGHAAEVRCEVSLHMCVGRRWKDPPPDELLHSVAASTAGFAGADLAALCAAAVHAAVRRAAPALLEQLDRRIAAAPIPDVPAVGSGAAASRPPPAGAGWPALGSPQVPAAQAAHDRATEARGLRDVPEDPPPSIKTPAGDTERLTQSVLEAPSSAAPSQALSPAEGGYAAQPAHAAERDAVSRDGALLDAVQVCVPPILHHGAKCQQLQHRVGSRPSTQT